MQRLARTTAKELKTANHCAVYQKELVRVWPKNDGTREKAVMEFAQKSSGGGGDEKRIDLDGPAQQRW